MIPKNEIKKLDNIKNIYNVYLVMDLHTILHNSENLLSSLCKRYGEQKVNLNVSLKNCQIPNTLDDIFSKKDDIFMANIA